MDFKNKTSKDSTFESGCVSLSPNEAHYRKDIIIIRL